VHFYRNVSTQVPHTNVREVMAMMKAIHAQENRTEAKKKAAFVVERLQQMKLKNAALLVVDGIDDTLSYYGFPPEHWRRIRTNNPLERIIREVRRRTQVVGSFPDGHAALMLVAARLRHVSGSKWGTRRYLDMDLLRHHLQEAS
jgi:transposase-like protein